MARGDAVASAGAPRRRARGDQQGAPVWTRLTDSARPADAYGLTGPAARTAAGALCAKFAKFSVRSRASRAAVASYSPASGQVSRGRKSALGIPGADRGTAKPNTGSTSIATSSREPSRMAATAARVRPIGIRFPVPYGPPVQPVLTSQTCDPCRSNRSPNRLAYRIGGSGRNGAPKHAENVALGVVTPRSVPATFAV